MGNSQNIEVVKRNTIGVDHILLANDGVELFIINQDVPLLAYEELLETLDDNEHHRMRQYLSRKLQLRYAVRRGMLRHLVGDALNIAPKDITFKYGAYGKPSISNHLIYFNLSHSQQYSLIGLCRSEIGVDLEYMRPSDDFADITQTHFSVDEQAAWRALSASEQVQGFYNAWTRKEAFIKMDGRGLQIPLDSFSVSLNPSQDAEILSSDRVDARHWRLWDIPAPSGFAGALVVGTQVQQIRLVSYIM